jgi:subtilase family serine protease
MESTMRQLFLPSSVILALALGGCGGSNGGGTLPQHIAASNSAQRTLRTPLGPTSILPAPSNAKSQVSLCVKPSDSAHAGCFATVRTDSVITGKFPDAVNGLTPNDISSLYAYPAPGAQGTAGSAQTVAIVVVGDYALAESDLGVYRSFFRLPPCTTANGCLRKTANVTPTNITDTGGATSIAAHAATAAGWAAETDADIEIMSAVCPNCKIMISEAPTNSIGDLSYAVSNAAYAGATIVNASFGAAESSIDTSFGWAYENIKNVKVVAAAGDGGYGVYFPASEVDTIAVGGTSLSINGSTVSETAWSGTSSGCSAYYSTPTWQHVPAVSNACHQRNIVDVAAVADPNTGVAVYDSTLSGSSGGWATFGGTSIAAPIITGMYALSGDTARNTGAQTLYTASSGSFLPVTSGSDGTCNPQYLCTAVAGYNGPAGLGIPHGLGGF